MKTSIIPHFFHEKSLQSFAQNDNSLYAKRRATNALATHQWPLTQPTIGVSIMPLIPITALIVFLQGRRA